MSKFKSVAQKRDKGAENGHDLQYVVPLGSSLHFSVFGFGFTPYESTLVQVNHLFRFKSADKTTLRFQRGSQ